MKRHTCLVDLAAVLLGVMLLAACGGGAPAVQEIKVDASEFKFEPATLSLKVGQPVRVMVANIGALEHTFTITDLGVDQDLPVGQTVTVEFTATQSGTFDLVCTTPGHKEAGMVGTVVVNP